MKQERTSQHYVPRRYLSAWCDPSLKQRHVWQFSADGKSGSPVSPRKIFVEDEFYTRTGVDGSRDLSLENLLGKLESRFGSVRKILLEGQWPTDSSITDLKMFAMAMFYRTKAQRDFHREQWGRLKKLGELTAQSVAGKPRDELQWLYNMTRSKDYGRGMTLAEVNDVASKPMQHLLLLQMQVAEPIFRSLDVAVFVTLDEPGFITSDSPCVLIDERAAAKPPMFRTPNLLSPEVEMWLPISPSLLLVLNRAGLSGFVPMGRLDVAKVNRRMRSGAQDYFVVSRNELRPEWFQ